MNEPSDISMWSYWWVQLSILYASYHSVISTWTNQNTKISPNLPTSYCGNASKQGTMRTCWPPSKAVSWCWFRYLFCCFKLLNCPLAFQLSKVGAEGFLSTKRGASIQKLSRIPTRSRGLWRAQWDFKPLSGGASDSLNCLALGYWLQCMR